jgi:hypothetical protein
LNRKSKFGINAHVTSLEIEKNLVVKSIMRLLLMSAAIWAPAAAQTAPPPAIEAGTKVDAPISVTNAGADQGDAGAEGLAMQLSNPVAALISVPLRFDFDGDIGPDKAGSRVSFLIQPVIPISISENYNLISRTILPIVWQKDVLPGSGTQFGLSDTVQSFFVSPAKPKGIVWGVGPALLVPTGTDDLLSTRKWGAGPSVLLLNQSGPWTVGLLANHIWSYAGNSARADVNATLVNPFVTYTTPTAFTVVVQADINRDWEGKRWTVPATLNASQVTKIGNQLVQIGGALRYYVASNEFSAKGFAARFTIALLFPR